MELESTKEGGYRYPFGAAETAEESAGVKERIAAIAFCAFFWIGIAVAIAAA